MPDSFTWRVELPISEEEVGLKMLISAGEDSCGPEQIRVKGGNPRLLFRCPINFQSVSDADAVYTFYTAHLGVAFYWTRPSRGSGDSSVQYTVRFHKQGLKRDWFRAGLYQMQTMEFIEDRR